MAKIQAYKFINPGMAEDNASEGSLVGRKLTLSFNRLGKTLNGVGSVVKDIESIEIARIKNDALRERMERRQAQRDRDADAEEDQERAKLAKKDASKPSAGKIKGFFGRSKAGKALMSALPAWMKALQPLFTLITEILKITVIKEMLVWWSKKENKKKIEEFFRKANVIFTKLKEFADFVWNQNIVQGWEQFKNGDTLKDRIGGLGKLMLGIGIISVITNPLTSIGIALTGLGWCIKNITEWLKNPFKGIKKPNVKGPNTPKSGNSKNGTEKTKLKNKYQKWLEKQKTNKKVDLKAIKNVKNKFNIGKTKVTVKGSTPYIPPKGSATKTLKPKGWKSVLSKAKNWASKAKMPGWMGKAGKFFGPTTTTVLAGLELNDRLNNKNESPEKAITGTTAGVVGGLGGFSIGAKTAAATLSPLLVTPIPGARLLYGAGVIVGGLTGSTIGATTLSATSDAAFDAHEDDNKQSKWWNPFSWNKNNTPEVKQVQPKTEFIPKKEVNIVKETPKDTKKKNNFWGNLFGGWGKNKSKKNDVVTPQPVVKQETKKADTGKKWWQFWKGDGGPLPEFFFGKIFKGVTKAVGSVFKGVKNAVGSVVNTVSSVVSNPIIGTALSFVPGVGPIIQGINAFNALRQGNIMGAVMSGVGALGSFANINTVNAISQPRWMQNLRFSKFGQGLANMYHTGANAWSGLTTGFNNFMGSNWGQLAKGVYQGVSGGGWGGALSAGMNITGLNKPGGLFGEGGFFGEGGRMANFGNWLQEHNLAGVGNMFPGLAGLANSIPGFANLPGIQDIFAGGFSPMQAIGAVAEKNGMGGLYKSAMGLLGGGDMYTGLKEIAGEIGVNPEALGAVEKGKSLYDRAKSVALQKDPVELLPIVMPIIKDQIVISPAVKEKAIIVHNAYNSLMGRM